MPLLRHILDTNKTLTRLLQTLDKIISIKVVQDFPLEIFYLFLLKKVRDTADTLNVEQLQLRPANIPELGFGDVAPLVTWHS